ncbi:MAG: hypothetical protein R3A51_12385 [Nannocystaceae bacterium]
MKELSLSSSLSHVPMLRRTLSIVALLSLFVTGAPHPKAEAHLAKWGSWEITHRNLMKLFPEADPNAWRIKRYQYNDGEVTYLEKQLGFALYPEDKQPEFFIAQDRSGELLGVAIFIDPRTKPKILDGGVLTLEVGIGVNAQGAINRIRVYDYRGNVELTKDAFLDQLRDRQLDSNFTMGEGTLRPVPGEPEESQLVSNAAREALLLMKVALGR